MCKCTPEFRTPYCGRPGCEWPEQTVKPEKRKYIFVGHPVQYEIRCDKCGGINIWWSEFEHMIWCYDCKVDTKGTGGIFDGPIPFNALKLIGLSLDRINLETGKLEICKVEDSGLVWEESDGLRVSETS